MGVGPYDIKITRSNGTTYGYVADWHEKDCIKIQSAPPELPVGTSTGLTKAGGDFSGRDSAPPYPISIDNWQEGAGQKSYDKEKARAGSFEDSHWIDVSDEGHFELGPMAFLMDITDALNVVGTGNGALFAAFDNTNTDPLKVLGRYKAVSHVTDFLTTASDTTFAVTAATGLTELADDGAAKLDATHGINVGDYLYCPIHNELVQVTVVSTLDLTVTRGEGGTTAVAHSASETWYGLKWYPVSFDGTDPTQDVSAICEMGGMTYAAFHDVGTTNGSVWKGAGFSTTDDWTEFTGTDTNVVALTGCAGYLCGVREGVSNATEAGYWNTANTWVVASVAAATSDNPLASGDHSLVGFDPTAHVTAGLETVNNYVYWVTSDGSSRSHVYRYQPGVAASFALVASLPPGFIASSALGHLGNLYIGGWLDTQDVDPDNATQGRYQGALYVLAGDSDLSHLVTFKDTTHDFRIKGLSASGPNIHILTNEDVRIWNVEHGAWWHYADISAGQTYGETGDIDWDAAGFTYSPSANGSKYPDVAGSCTGAANGSAGVMVQDSPSSPGISESIEAGTEPYAGIDFYKVGVTAGKWTRFTMDTVPPADLGTVELDTSPYGDVQAPYSQGGTVVMAGSSKEVRVYIHGNVSGGTSTQMRFGLGTYSGSYSYNWTGYMGNRYVHRVRITLDTNGAKLYVDGSLALSTPYANLKTVTGGDATQTWFSAGWPGDAQGDSNVERLGVRHFKMTPTAAYPPDYVSTPTTTSMKGIACYEGRTCVPAPGVGINYIDPRFQNYTGYLDTSESAFHMGTVDKEFSTVDVTHSALIDTDQKVTVAVYVDGNLATTAVNNTAGTTITTADVDTKGKRIKVRVTLYDGGNVSATRDWDYRLRVSNITARFFPHNAKKVFTVKLNCRENVELSNGQPWDYDPDEAIRHIFTIADEGEICTVEMLWGNFTARLDQVEVTQGKSERYHKILGDVSSRMREI